MKIKKTERKTRNAESVSDSSDTECSDETVKGKKLESLMVTANRHSKVFFENDDGNIFSIYRCLLHHKKVCSFVYKNRSFEKNFVISLDILVYDLIL